MVENGVLQQERNDLEKQSKRLKNQVEKLKGSNAQLEARVQSLMAEVAELKTQLYLVQIPQERVIERIERVPVVEKVGNQSLLAQVERLGQKVMALEAENQRLLGMLETAIISQAIPVDEDVMEPEPVFNPGGTPAEKLDYILKQRGQ
jgi:chromosome segregation ATPase